MSTIPYSSPVFYALFSAFLTTVLSYQSALILTDLCFGKPSQGKAKLSDIGALLLIQEMSILSITTAIFDTDFLRRMRYSPELHRYSTSHQSGSQGAGSRLHCAVLLKVLVLLFGIPLINAVSIILLLEKDQEYTFEQAKFGGVALGRLNESNWVHSDNRSNPRTFLANLGPGVKNETRFVMSSIGYCHSYGRKLDLSNSNATVTVISGLSSFNFSLSSPPFQFSVTVIANLRAEKSVFRLPQIFSSEDFRDISRKQALQLLGLCRSQAGESKMLMGSFEDNPTSKKVSFHFMCRKFQVGDFHAFQKAIYTSFVPVSTPSLQIADIDSSCSKGIEIREEFFRSGDNLPLMTQRRPTLSFSNLLIATAISFLLRMLMKTASRNYLSVALELLTKRALGMNWFEDMLCSDGDIDFRGEPTYVCPTVDIVDTSELAFHE